MECLGEYVRGSVSEIRIWRRQNDEEWEFERSKPFIWLIATSKETTRGFQNSERGSKSVFIPWDYVTAKHCPERVQPWAEETAHLLKRLSQKCEGLSLLPRIQVKKKKRKKQCGRHLRDHECLRLLSPGFYTLGHIYGHISINKMTMLVTHSSPQIQYLYCTRQ